MRNIMHFIGVFSLALALAGCATGGSRTVAGADISDPITSLKNGEIRLECDTACAAAWGSARRVARGLYDAELWSDLTYHVVKVGHRVDQAYFYLGRAAEGLRHFQAAKIYFRLAAANGYKCAGFINVCDGLDVPSATREALMRVEQAIAAETSKSEAPKADIRPAEAQKTEVSATSPAKSEVPATTTSKNGGPSSVSISSLSFGKNETLINDIEAMRKETLSKGSFETNFEHKQRRSRYIDEFARKKGYRITLDIDNAQNDKEKLVHFDPDTEELRIAMPQITRRILFLETGEAGSPRWIHYSFVPIHSTDQKLGTYQASNRLGASIDVLEMAVTRYGLAVLSQATRSYGTDSRQTFTTHMKKDDARELLAKGRIVMEFSVDPRYPSNRDNPLLLIEKNEHKPKFDSPVDATDTRYAIPVRLLRVRLVSRAGAEIFSSEGQQIDVEALTY